MATYVQYGAGYTAGEGWLNFDASPTLRAERVPLLGGVLGSLWGNPQRYPPGIVYGDIVKGLLVADGTVDGLYASHVLEHLSLWDMRIALGNSLRMLRPGGVFRLVVPDLRERARRYVAAGGDGEAASRFMRQSLRGLEGRERKWRERLRRAFGNAEHLWMYDHASMAAELAAAGFTDIRRAEFGDAADRMFDRVEDRSRFVEEDGTVEVAIEARRPLSS